MTTYHRDPKQVGPQNTSIKFGGRTVVMSVIVNTDEDADAVALRVQEAARGPKQRMAMTGTDVLTGHDGMAVWMDVKRRLAAIGVDQSGGDRQ